MRFSTKIFIALATLTLTISSLVIWSSYYYLKQSRIKSFSQSYQLFSAIVGDTLVQMEQNTELLMRNAAQLVALEQRRGPAEFY